MVEVDHYHFIANRPSQSPRLETPDGERTRPLGVSTLADSHLGNSPMARDSFHASFA
jgi:hypothetical protein